MKKTIIMLLALQASLSAHAQTTCNASFEGKVTDDSNQPIPGAAVVLHPGELGQATDLSGNFRFSDLCPGTYTVEISSLGFHAQEFEIRIGDSVNRNFRLTEVATQLDEVIVQQHHDATLTEHANNLVQLDERKLAESAGKTLGETLKGVSGVGSIQSGPGIFKPVIHGVHSQRILILNHGIRQEGQQWGAEHAPEIDPFIASNVIVIKDASAIKYGTDALGGVIVVNPSPLPETNKLGGTLNSVLQSNGRSGTFSGMLEGGIARHDGWGWRIQGTAKRAGDFSTPDYTLTNTGIRELNFSAAAGYHEKGKGFDIFFSRFSTTIGILKGTSIGNLDDLVSAMERDVPAYTTGFSYAIGEPRQDVSHNLLKLNGHFKATHGEWRWQYGFQNNNRKEYDLRIGDLSKIPSIDLQLNTHSVDVEWETHHSDKRTMSVGLSGMYQVNRNIYGTQRIPFIPNFTNLSGGAFFVSRLFFNTWTVDAGVRYDYRNYDVKGFDFKNSYYNDQFSFNNISATVGATKSLGPHQSLSASISSAWRPPHVAELYSVGTHQSAAAIEYGLLLNDSTNEVRNINDVNFRTEQAVKFVGTYRYERDGFTFEATPFANYIFNYIYLRPVGITTNIRGVYPYFRYQQTDALFLGGDISATWRIAKNMSITPQVSLLRASDEDNDDKFVFVPSNRYQLTFRYERPALGNVTHFYVESRLNYTARQGNAPRVVTVRDIQNAREEGSDPFGADRSNFDFLPAPEGYLLWNLATGFSLKREKTQYDFRLASENTLNQRYREYTNRFRYYADELGRNIILSIKCIF